STPARQSRAVLSALAAAGIVGPLVFTLGVVAQGLYRPDYHPLAQQISDLTARGAGWVQQGDFVVCWLLVMGVGVGLHQGLGGAARGVIGPTLVAWNGMELVIAGVFPLREDAAGRIYDPLGVHRVNGTIFFLSIGVVLVVLSRQLAREASWRGLATYTLVTGIVVLVLVLLNGLLAAMAQAPLHPLLVLIQRAVLAVWFACLIVLALRLRRVGRREV